MIEGSETMIQAFSFVDAGRTYTCSIKERRSGEGMISWWWFDVSGDKQRYAPFHATSEDTELSVRYRIVSYYDDLMTRRGLPLRPYPR